MTRLFGYDDDDGRSPAPGSRGPAADRADGLPSVRAGAGRPSPTRSSWAETAVGETVEWYTPPELFEAIGLTFDLDPCSPMAGPVPWVPARRFLSPAENGLVVPWEGRVWLNPPYGPLAPAFLHRLAEHGDGIALVFARTETRWFQSSAPRADAVVFLRNRVSFVRQDGTREARGRTGSGSLLLAYGEACASAVARADLGWTVRR